MEKKYLTTKEAAEYLRISVGRLIRNKKIPYYAPDGTRRRYRLEDLERWLESGKHN